MRVVATALLAMLCGCGRIGYGQSEGDGAADDAMALLFDASVPAKDRDLELGAWPTPTVIAALADPARDDDPSATADRLELYFSSTRAGTGGSDLWVSQRDAATDPWGAPTEVTALNTQADEDTPEISGDGLTLFFTRGMNDTDIYEVTRARRDGPWGTPSVVAELNSTKKDHSPTAYRGLLAVAMTSDRTPSVGGYDLFQSSRARTSDPWSMPAPIAELDTPMDEMGPFVVEDDTLIYFYSNQGTSGDIWRAARASAAEPFGAPELVNGLDTPSYEEDPWLASDLRYVLFASDRDGNEEIYEASR